MSVKINRKLLDKCQNSITVLEEEIQRLKSADSERLKDEYDRLVAGLRQGYIKFKFPTLTSFFPSYSITLEKQVM